MKKVTLTSLFAVVLSVSIFGSSSAAFASPSNINAAGVLDKTWTQSSKVASGGEEIGELNTTYQFHRSLDRDGTAVVDVVVTKDYELLLGATEIQKEEFSDSTNTYEIKVTNDQQYYINGKKLSDEELSAPVPTSSNSNISLLASQDTGGVPSVSHYYGDFTNYHLASYSDLNIMGGPQGSNHQADGKITNVYVQRAMSVIDSFSGDYNTMNTSREAFMVAAGLAVVTVEGIITAIAAGSAGVAAAIACYDEFQDCKSDLSQICNYIDLV